MHDFKAFSYIISVFDNVKVFQSKGVIKELLVKEDWVLKEIAYSNLYTATALKITQLPAMRKVLV